MVTGSAASRLPPPSSDPKPSSEPVIVLKGLVKPQSSESDSDEEHKEVEAKFASVGIQNGKDSDYPDEETIRAIRAQRERARQARPAAPDYISLDGGSNHGAAEGLSDEEPEFRGRIALIGEKVEGGKKKGVFEDVEERDGGFKGGGEDEVGDDDDEEEKLWEEEQFRKGLGKRMDEGPAARVGGSDVPVVQAAQQNKFVVPSAAAVYGGAVPTASAGVSVSTSIGGAFQPTPVLDVVPMSQQAEIVRKAMLDNVRRLKVSINNDIIWPNWLFIMLNCCLLD